MKIFDRFWGTRSIFTSLVAALVVLLLVSSSAVPSYGAAALITRNGYIDNVKVIGYGDVTAASTVNVTTYVDLAGSNITYTPTYNDCTTAARLGACLIEVDFSLDLVKATAGTATCSPFVNGAVSTTAARTITSTGGNENIGGVFIVTNSTVGAQTLKIQCKNSDTNVLTVNFGHVVYREIIPPYAR